MSDDIIERLDTAMKDRAQIVLMTELQRASNQKIEQLEAELKRMRRLVKGFVDASTEAVADHPTDCDCLCCEACDVVLALP